PLPVEKVPVLAEKSKLLAPPAAVTFFPLARVVLPFKPTAPVPVEKVLAPVTAVLPLRETAPLPVGKVPRLAVQSTLLAPPAGTALWPLSGPAPVPVARLPAVE